jgi:hypothetical protein
MSNEPKAEDNAVVKLLKRANIPVTRENYINLAYVGQPPEEWTVENEMELPEQLRLPQYRSE